MKSINPHQPSDVIGEFEETGYGGAAEAGAPTVRDCGGTNTAGVAVLGLESHSG